MGDRGGVLHIMADLLDDVRDVCHGIDVRVTRDIYDEVRRRAQAALDDPMLDGIIGRATAITWDHLDEPRFTYGPAEVNAMFTTLTADSIAARDTGLLVDDEDALGYVDEIDGDGWRGFLDATDDRTLLSLMRAPSPRALAEAYDDWLLHTRRLDIACAVMVAICGDALSAGEPAAAGSERES